MNYLVSSITVLNFIRIFALASFLISGVAAQKNEIKDYSGIFGKYGVDGCFILYDATKASYIMYNPDLCDTGYIPASTFKIPNALIALEEGIITDSNQVIPWDGHEWDYKVWNQDQTLASALTFSCVWVFVKIAGQVGIPTYQAYVDSFNYGNRNLTGPPDRFWLAGDFRVSAKQQVEFLEKFYNYKLPIATNNIDLVKRLLTIKQTDSFTLFAKTGGGVLPDDNNIMWYVGYLEKEGKPYFFATNFISDDFNKTKGFRAEITREILVDLDLME